MRRFFCTLMMSALLALMSRLGLAEEDQIKTSITTTTPSGAVVERREILTPSPPLKVLIPIPPGSVSCFTVKAGWNQRVWATAHDVCIYSNSPKGTMWVFGYWVCDKYVLLEEKCLNWNWKAAHWEKSAMVY